MSATLSPAVGIEALPNIGPAAVVMGAFDGVHVGHAAMLSATREAGARLEAAAVALVFEPHPDEVLRPGTRVPRLAPLHTTLERIVRDHGLDHAIPLRFDDALRALAAEEFLAAMAPSVQLRALIMSPESAFGRNRGGTVDRMREHGEQVGFEVVTVEPVLVDGGVVSSTRQRTAIAAGDVAGALALGYPPRLEGSVVVGDRRGRLLGYPTANLAFDYLPAMPARGIYVGWASVPERGVGPQHPALVSVGVRPTFHDTGEVLVEVHLLDFDADLYGALLAVDLLARLRDELRFGSAEELVDQMRRDEAAGRAFLAMRRRRE